MNQLLESSQPAARIPARSSFHHGQLGSHDAGAGTGRMKQGCVVPAVVCRFVVAALLTLLTGQSLGQTISSIAGTGLRGFSGDGQPAIDAMLNDPYAVLFDAAGNVWFSDADNNRVRKISPLGTITTVAGTGVAGYSGDGGLAVQAQFNGPTGLAMDGWGNLFVSDINNHRVRRVSTNGIISTVTGTGTAGFSGDGSYATNAFS